MTPSRQPVRTAERSKCASLRFYVDRLGFTVPWRVEADGRTDVAEVDRQGCALILCPHWPEKVGRRILLRV
jgi:hypothetical protein